MNPKGAGLSGLPGCAKQLKLKARPKSKKANLFFDRMLRDVIGAFITIYVTQLIDNWRLVQNYLFVDLQVIGVHRYDTQRMRIVHLHSKVFFGTYFTLK